MKNSIKLTFFLCLVFSYLCNSQSIKPYTASFIAKLGTDTIIVETYSMIHNHLYGKAFLRVPEDYISQFSIHFYPDGSIREFNVMPMNPLNSSVPFEAKSGSLAYRQNMNCQNDTCTFYNSRTNDSKETIIKHKTDYMNFVGGWTPYISLIEWNCMKLAKSGLQQIPLKMINSSLGVFDIGLRFSDKATMIFGGPFLEYAKIKANAEGRINSYDGTGTPWNYIISKHETIDIDLIAKRLAKKPPIGNPSPTATFQATIQNTKIDISYSKPSKRGRKIFGGIVPLDSVWRTGAGGATTINFEQNVKFYGTIIPKGKYSIYTIPKQSDWQLIFNTDLKTWPTNPDKTKDFAQITIPIKKSKDIIEQLTIEVIESKNGGILQILWDNVIAYAVFEVLKN